MVKALFESREESDVHWFLLMTEIRVGPGSNGAMSHVLVTGRQEASGTVAYGGRESALNDVCPESDRVHRVCKRAAHTCTICLLIWKCLASLRGRGEKLYCFRLKG